MIEMVNNMNSFTSFVMSVISIIVSLGFLIGFYYRTRAGFEQIKFEIEEIQKDREAKWRAYAKNQDFTNNCYKELLVEIKILSGDIREVKTDLKWLKDKSE